MKAKLASSCRKCCAIFVLCAVFLHIASAESRNTEASHEDFPNLYLLEAQAAAFPAGQRYAVYSGPGEDYLRGANGKAAVSTNASIQSFAKENGWIMIEYAIDDAHHRIGWIQEIVFADLCAKVS